ILNVIDHRMILADAMSAPRLHHQALPDTILVEANGLPAATLDSLARTIDPSRKTPTPPNGAPITDGMHTTHYSVVDDKGNAVATTTTLNNGYGSAVYLKNVGFFMNDEMDDFASAPGKPNMFGLVQGEANAIQPGKRMLSAMSPSIVLDPRGQVLLIAGGRGGDGELRGLRELGRDAEGQPPVGGAGPRVRTCHPAGACEARACRG
ncbi:MAG TPA: gamma-glutamyltransferase, partial [Gemmatimonadaceae bacterium]|nr:gamma-glutamyltransferase [Gemmatimonadaceae bacterium]